MMIKSVIGMMRPKHWVKNTFVFAPLLFSQSVLSVNLATGAAMVFISFSLMASAIYFFNDIFDIENDRQHPDKSGRPLPSGRVSIPVAVLVSIILLGMSITLSFATNIEVTRILIIYAGINVLYSVWLKHVVIIDVFCVASGFVLRILAGAIAIGVSASPWILICTLLLALFMALGKRRHELVLLEENSTSHRPVLGEYTPYLVDQLIAVITPLTVISYVLYTLDEDTIERFGSDYFFVTGGFVMLGIFRYLYIIHRRDLAGSPVELLFKDVPFQFTVIAWMVSVVIMIY